MDFEYDVSDIMKEKYLDSSGRYPTEKKRMATPRTNRKGVDTMINTLGIVKCENCRYRQPSKIEGKMYCVQKDDFFPYNPDGFCGAGVAR